MAIVLVVLSSRAPHPPEQTLAFFASARVGLGGLFVLFATT